MASYSFHRIMMGKVEIGNFYCLIGYIRILYLQKCLLNSSPHFIRLLMELLNLIGCRATQIVNFLKKSVSSRLKVHRGHVYDMSD